MVEKNMSKERAKRNRVTFEGRLCTVVYKSKKHPSRWDTKKDTRNLVAQD